MSPQQKGSSKSFQTALCLIPPRAAWPPIQAIRHEHDAAFKRWMPHVNIVWPFVGHDDLDEAAKLCQAELASIPPFNVTLSRFGAFQKKAGPTVHLKIDEDPANSLNRIRQTLQQALLSDYPQVAVSDRPFSPHLTVGQWGKRDDPVTELQKNWQPLTFQVAHLYIISRAGDVPFAVRHELALGTTTEVPRPITSAVVVPSADKGDSGDDGTVRTARACYNASTNSAVMLETSPAHTDTLAHVEAKIALDGVKSGRRSDESTLLVLVVDRSGSMCGRSWTQVQSAIEAIPDAMSGSNNIRTSLIVYNGTANEVEMSQIGQIRATGRTSFPAAFDLTRNVIQRKTVSRRFDHVFVGFMTDGHDTSGCTDLRGKVKDFSRYLESLDMPTTVHVLGFGGNHSYDFLEQVRQAGSNHGGFRYCEAGDGNDAVKSKFMDMFDSAFVAGANASVMVDIPGVTLVSDPAQQTPVKLPLTVPVRAGDGYATISCWAKLDSTEVAKRALRANVSVMRGDVQLGAACDVTVLIDPADTSTLAQTLWNGRVDKARITELAATIAEQVGKSAGKPISPIDLVEWSMALQELQTICSNIKIFGIRGLGKSERQVLCELRAEMQEKLDAISGIIAGIQREGQTTAALARANDIRYEALFRKARRQRLMDRRVATNTRNLGDIDARLAEIVRSIDLDKVDNMSQDARDLFFCDMSQMDITEVLSDRSGDALDQLGICLAVARPEHAIDDPSQIRIHEVSSTLACLSAIEDAIKYSIQINDHCATHGGFDLSAQLGVATVGRAREPINAWLPLYVSAEHWQSVKVLLKSSLGYFATLDHLGYSPAQLDVPCLVLGTMIARMHDCQTRQLQIVFAFQRTCYAVACEFGMIDRIHKTIRDFAAGPAGRTKDVVPSLTVLLGYLAMLPADEAHKCLPTAHDRRRFWLGIIEESFRRAMHGALKNRGADSESVGPRNIAGIHEILVFGAKNGVADAYDRHAARDENGGDVNVSGGGFDPNAVSPPGTATGGTRVAVPAMDASDTMPFSLNASKLTNETARMPADTFLDLAYDAGHKLASAFSDTGGEGVDKAQAREAMYNYRTILPSNWRRGEKVKSIKGKVYLGKLPASKLPADVKADKKVAESGEWVDITDAALAYVTRDEARSDSEIVTLLNRLQHVFRTRALINPLVISRFHTFVNTWRGICEQSTNTRGVYDTIDAHSGVAPDEWITAMLSAFATLKRASDTSAVTIPELIADVSNECAELASSGVACAITRAMAAQVVSYHANSHARDAIDSGDYIDLGEATTVPSALATARNVLDRRARSLWRERFNVVKAIGGEQLRLQVNARLCATSDMDAFVGYLLESYKDWDRDEGYKHLIRMLMYNKDNAPLVVEKMQTLLSATYEDHPVIGMGNAWLPDGPSRRLFVKRFGLDMYGEIESVVAGTYTVHVYRESDLPNRHGHCNSFPYIPPEMRDRVPYSKMR